MTINVYIVDELGKCCNNKGYHVKNIPFISSGHLIRNNIKYSAFDYLQVGDIIISPDNNNTVHVALVAYKDVRLSRLSIHDWNSMLYRILLIYAKPEETINVFIVNHFNTINCHLPYTARVSAMLDIINFPYNKYKILLL